jgi:C4-dicarboxylate transporter DctQ subunit
MKKKRVTPEEVLGGVLMALIFVCATFQVLNRFILHFSAPWTEEVCRYAFIWIALLGIANGVKRGTHLNVNLIDGVLSPKAKLILELLLDIVCLALMAYMFKISVDYLARVASYGTKSVGLGIQMWIIYLILPLFSALTIIRLIEKYVRMFLGKGKEKEEKGAEE